MTEKKEPVWIVYQGVVSKKWYAKGPFLKQQDTFQEIWEWLEIQRNAEPS